MRHGLARLISCALLAMLCACQKAEEENVQVRAENASRALEQRYKEIEAEAQNSVDEAVAPLDAEANALLANQAAGDANVSVNAQ